MYATGRQPDRLLRLAICEASPEDQEWVVASLRSAGIPCRASPFFNAASLSEMISASEVDVVVWGEGATGCSLEQTLKCAGTVPVVVAASAFPNELLGRVRLAGASDVYVRDNPALAAHVLSTQAEINSLRQRAASALAAAQDMDKRCDALIDAVADPIAYLSEGLHVKANQAYVDLMGLDSFDDLEGMSILDFVDSSSTEEVREKIKRLGRESLPAEQMDVQLSSGQTVPMTFSSAHYDGEPCLQLTVQRQSPPLSVSVLPAASAGTTAGAQPPPSLEAWMKKDAATGLFSRAHFLEELGSTHAGFCWVIQLEHHNKIVSTVGPTRLDQVMFALGQILSRHLPEAAISARWTGGLVAILTPDLDREGMGKIRQLLAREFLEVAGRSFQSPIVAGGVVLNESLDADQVATMLEQALSEARTDGTGLCLVDPLGKAKAHASQMAEEVARLKASLENDTLPLFYQPIVSLMGGPEAYEMMVRMPSGSGLMEPGQFSSLVEKSGLSLELDKWLVRKAAEQIALREAKGRPTHVLVSLSPSSMGDPGFPDYVESCLSKHQAAADRLAFEVNMVVALTHAKQTLEFKRAMTAKGHALLVSGVGMDVSSLKSLSVLSPSWIKLSQEGTARLAQSAEGAEELEALLSAASKDNIKVLVGFVEDAVVLTTLFSLGVDSAQGNFLSPPLSAMTYDFSQFMG